MEKMQLIKAGLVSIMLLPFGLTARADNMPDAKTELNAAIDLLKARHMNSNKMDWPTVQTKALAMLGSATKPEEAYAAIRYVIAQLGEKHTSMVPADAWKAMMTDTSVGKARAPDWQPPEGHLLEGRIGLVELKAYQGSPTDDLAYASAARSALRTFADNHVCRYIVDLRFNTGGNMYPMINGVEALLGKSPYGFWQATGGAPDSSWTLKRGTFEHEGAPADETVQSKAAVAVLIDRRTASSGEFTAMAFEGRPNTRVFGENSAGFLTFNSPAALPDGARLIISEGWATDRLRRPYRDVIAPDQATPRGQATLDAAIVWLKNQPCP
ncbi:MAG TPA: S41 family peptidase [Rhizomicrobium sp.]|nr:S41 family peptidase [Rhizomicrobium sp.]